MKAKNLNSFLKTFTVELQWLESFGTMKICLRQGKFELMSVNHSARPGSIIGISFRFFNMKVRCVFSLKSHHRGDSNEHTQYSIFIIQRQSP